MKPYHRNPRRITQTRHARLTDTLARLGDLGGIVHNLETDEVIGGNQRMTVFKDGKPTVVEAYDQPDEQGTVGHGFIIWQGKKYAYRQVRWDEQTAAEANIAANLGAGDWDWDALSGWDAGDLQRWGFDGELLAGWQTDIGALRTMLDVEDMLGVPKDAKPNPRNLPIDVIFCWGGGDTSCCLAVRSGWLYGVRSSDIASVDKICPVVARSERHAVQFVDNEFKAYDHNHHLSIVRSLKPRYATVRDVMTEQQCQEAGIEYFELAKILAWAEELSQHADNVIVIPKYDCLDQIPDKFMLGYSVPTSYGGTPLPVAAFKGRRVHLLGGSWKAQLAHMAELGDDVVSMDNNHVERVASMWGQYCDPEGVTTQLKEIGLGYLINVRDVALCMSFGAIGAKVNELYAGSATPAE